MSKSSRNTGIDTLRILSMLGVVFLHVLGHGGIIPASTSPIKFSIVWFFDILSYPAVNCFAVISGYVGYREERSFPRLKNILSLFFTVLFYSTTILLAFKQFGIAEISDSDILKSVLPTIMGEYWFFTAYFATFLLSPILNLFVRNSEMKHAVVFLSALSLFSIISIQRDSFHLINGYSLIWLFFMYLTGALFKKHNLNRLLSTKAWLGIVFVAFAITYSIKVGFTFTSNTALQPYKDKLMIYVSPTIVLMATGLLGAFSKIKCPSFFGRILPFLSTSAFSVYLIHDNFLVRQHLMSRIHTFSDNLEPVPLTLFIIGTVLSIFLSCILADKVRILLFRIFRIDKLSEFIAKIIKSAINTVSEKIELKINKATY